VANAGQFFINGSQFRINILSILAFYFSSVEYNTIRQRFPDVLIESYLEDKLLNVTCSAMHVAKSIMNLVLNAAEAIQTKGSITVSTKNMHLKKVHKGYETIEAGDYTVINVEDTGSGISKADLAKIFSPFYSKKIMGRSGTGLGLAVVWNTVHDHGGYIDMVSSNKGSLFSLYFPSTRIHGEISLQSFDNPTYRGNGQSVLVVDDQKSQREIAIRLLSRMGFQPYTVPSGEKAVEFIKNNKVDLVILDMLMEPGINGCETYRLILEHAPDQKAIITSGYSTTTDVHQAKNLGVTQFVKKPYSLQDLGDALQEVLSGVSLNT